MSGEGNTQVAYAAIREAIIEGRYPPGGRLKEQRVAEELDLSRTPVREALKMLEAEGLVVIEHNVGAVVRSVGVETIRDLYELRARLESYAAGLAASRRTSAQLAHLRDAVDSFSATARRATPHTLESAREVNRRNRAVHAAITEAAGHQRLATMLDRTVDTPLVFEAFRRFEADELQRSDTFHRLLANAIEAGESARAERLMIEHVYQGRDVLLAALADPTATIADATPT